MGNELRQQQQRREEKVEKEEKERRDSREKAVRRTALEGCFAGSGSRGRVNGTKKTFPTVDA